LRERSTVNEPTAAVRSIRRRADFIVGQLPKDRYFIAAVPKAALATMGWISSAFSLAMKR
jgi:hypothetical protein